MDAPTVILDFEPDWKETPQLGYSFETAIQQSPYFVEQRRPLVALPTRNQTCQYVFRGKDLQRARNVLLYGASRVCCVPIYAEPILAAAFTQGASSIVATTDISYLWNIQNCGYAVLLDFVSGQSEMLRVSSVSGQTINLSAAITKSWTAARTVLYPAFAGKISGIKHKEVTDLLGRVELECDEIRNTVSAATPVWVGLEEQVCPSGLRSMLVSAASNDAYYRVDAAVYDLLGSTGAIGIDTSRAFMVCRFQLWIPPAARILSASVQFYCTYLHWWVTAAPSTYESYAWDYASAPEITEGLCLSHPRIGREVWTINEGWGGAPVAFQYFNFPCTAGVQAAVSRAGWVPGNWVALDFQLYLYTSGTSIFGVNQFAPNQIGPRLSVRWGV